MTNWDVCCCACYGFGEKVEIWPAGRVRGIQRQGRRWGRDRKRTPTRMVGDEGEPVYFSKQMGRAQVGQRAE